MPEFSSINILGEDIKVKDIFSRKMLQYINVLYNKKILIMGDSITDPSVIGKENNWAVQLKNILNGIASVDINAHNGYRLSGNNGLAKLYNDTINNTYDIIIIFAGTNDYGQISPPELGSCLESNLNTFCGTLKYLSDSIERKNPNARIFYVSPTKRSLAVNEHIYPLSFYNWAIYCQSQKSNWTYINAYDGAPHIQNGLQNDGLHFTNEYDYYFCMYILSKLISGENDSYGNHSYTLNLTVSSLNAPIAFEWNNGVITYYIDSQAVNVIAGTTVLMPIEQIPWIPTKTVWLHSPYESGTHSISLGFSNMEPYNIVEINSGNYSGRTTVRGSCSALSALGRK